VEEWQVSHARQWERLRVIRILMQKCVLGNEVVVR